MDITKMKEANGKLGIAEEYKLKVKNLEVGQEVYTLHELTCGSAYLSYVEKIEILTPEAIVTNSERIYRLGSNGMFCRFCSWIQNGFISILFPTEEMMNNFAKMQKNEFWEYSDFSNTGKVKFRGFEFERK